MKKRSALGGIEMLLALLIIALLFLYFTGAFSGKNNENINGGENFKNTKEQIDVQIDEIQKQRQELNDEQQRRMRELNASY